MQYDGLETYNKTMSKILSMTQDQIDATLESPNTPLLTKIIASICVKAANKGDIRAIRGLLDRAHGTPAQSVEIKTENIDPRFDIEPINAIEASKIYQELMG